MRSSNAGSSGGVAALEMLASNVYGAGIGGLKTPSAGCGPQRCRHPDALRAHPSPAIKRAAVAVDHGLHPPVKFGKGSAPAGVLAGDGWRLADPDRAPSSGRK